MNVLSLFDGMSCGHLALGRAGIKVDNYFASEIDKYAMTVTQHNFSATVQLGDIKDWPLWQLPKIDLIIAGSPCQGFSFAGKQLNFEDPRSKLFFDFVDILKAVKPKYFLLENVKMKKEFQDIISNLLGVQPIEINSALVSAQNRKRLYWTNIPGIKQPEDKGILLKDIIEDAECDRDKSYCLDANYSKGANYDQYKNKCRRQLVKCGAFRGRYLVDGKRQDGKMQKDNVVVCRASVQKNSEHNIKNKSTTLTAAMGIGGGNIPMLMSNEDSIKYKGIYLDGDVRKKWRKLTPIECERLQTVPDNYTLVPFGKREMSNTQRYKMLGNGWTVDVISHIFKELLDGISTH